MSDGTPIPSFISVKSNAIYMETFDKSKIGNYTISFKGCDGYKLAILQYTIQVLDNTAPFINFAQI